VPDRLSSSTSTSAPLKRKVPVQREGRRQGHVFYYRGEGKHPHRRMAELLRMDRSATDTPPMIPGQPQVGDLAEEVGGGTPVGWRADLLDEVPDSEELEAGPHGSWE